MDSSALMMLFVATLVFLLLGFVACDTKFYNKHYSKITLILIALIFVFIILVNDNTARNCIIFIFCGFQAGSLLKMLWNYIIKTLGI